MPGAEIHRDFMTTRLFRCVAILVVSGWAGVAAAQSMQPPALPTPNDPTANAGPGSAEPGYLGMVADDRQDAGKGVRLVEVDDDSPAAHAGLERGDMVTAVNGQPVHSLDDFAAILRPQPAGAKVSFDFERQNAAQHVDLVLGRRPPPDQRRFKDFGRLPDAPPEEEMPGPNNQPATPAPSGGTDLRTAVNSGPKLGLRTVAVTDATRLRLGLSSTAGALVVARTVGSPAEKANIPLDSVITAFNGMAVKSPNDLASLVSRAPDVGTIDLAYVYNGRGFQTKLVLGRTTAATSPRNSMTGGTPRNDVSPSTAANTVTRSPAVLPPQVPPRSSTPNTSDAARIEALERRVHELEQRIQELEGRSQRGT